MQDIYLFFFVHTVTSVAPASFSTESVQQTKICLNCQSGSDAQRYWEKFFLLFFRLCQKNRYFRLFSSPLNAEVLGHSKIALRIADFVNPWILCGHEKHFWQTMTSSPQFMHAHCCCLG